MNCRGPRSLKIDTFSPRNINCRFYVINAGYRHRCNFLATTSFYGKDFAVGIRNQRHCRVSVTRHKPSPAPELDAQAKIILSTRLRREFVNLQSDSADLYPALRSPAIFDVDRVSYLFDF